MVERLDDSSLLYGTEVILGFPKVSKLSLPALYIAPPQSKWSYLFPTDAVI